VIVNYIRAGEHHSATVKITELPKETASSNQPPPAPEANQAQVIPASGQSVTVAHVLSGLQVTDLNDKTRQKFGIDDVVTSGVVVTGVQEGSIADARGVERGDVIQIACAQRGNIQPLASAADFTSLTKTLKPDQSVVLLVHHGKISGPEGLQSIFIYLAQQPK